MQILFNNWDISVKRQAPIVQGDNLSEPVTVEGQLPEDFNSWSLLLSTNGEGNVVSLGVIDGKPGVYLTGDMLPYGKTFYGVQLRGECGEKVKHSNVEYIYVSPSIAGGGTWPELPTEFSQTEARLRELNAHPPIPDENGEYWDVWDVDLHEYVLSEYPLPEEVSSSAAYDDTAIASRLSALESKEASWDGKSDFSGSYNDLSDKPTIPPTVTELTVSGWGFTKNTGTYTRPSGGIPKSDLASSVQTSLDKADGALQQHQSLSAYRTAVAQDLIDNGKQAKVNVSGILKGNGSGSVSAAVAGTDYQTPISFGNDPDGHISTINQHDLAAKYDNAGHEIYATYATKSEIPSIPTNVSEFTNDAAYLTLATLPIYNGGVS